MVIASTASSVVGMALETHLVRRGMGQKGVNEETVLDPDGQRMGQFVAVAERPVRFAVMKLLTQTDGSLWRDSQQALSPLHDDFGNTGNTHSRSTQ